MNGTSLDKVANTHHSASNQEYGVDRYETKKKHGRQSYLEQAHGI
jgi:hypothetical protein